MFPFRFREDSRPLGRRTALGRLADRSGGPPRAPLPSRRERAGPANGQSGYFVTALYWPDLFAGDTPSDRAAIRNGLYRDAARRDVRRHVEADLILINCKK